VEGIVEVADLHGGMIGFEVNNSKSMGAM